MGGIKVKAGVLLASCLLWAGQACASGALEKGSGGSENADESISMLIVADTKKEAGNLTVRGLESLGISKEVAELMGLTVESGDGDPEWKGFRVPLEAGNNHPQICVAVVKRGVENYFDVNDYFSMAVAGSAASAVELRYFQKIAYEFYLETQKEHCRAKGWPSSDTRPVAVQMWEEESEVFESAARAVMESGKFNREDVALFVGESGPGKNGKVYTGGGSVMDGIRSRRRPGWQSEGEAGL